MRRSITVVGGAYGEDCSFPVRQVLRGSGGRAAALLSSLGAKVTLATVTGPRLGGEFARIAKLLGYKLDARSGSQDIWFRYRYPHGHPTIFPAQILSIPDQEPISARIQLATLPQATNTVVSFEPEQLFGRHCAVLGTTGSGKSWTVARIAEEIVRLKGKAILFDAAGEYYRLHHGTRHVSLGGKKKKGKDQREFVSFPYRALTELDLFVLFQPSASSQAPKLREAIRSLKLASLEPTLASKGLLVKNSQVRAPIEKALAEHAGAIAAEGAHYDIGLLSAQINEECVWPTGRGANSHLFGGPQENELSYCATLVSRINVAVRSDFMACIFQPAGLPSLEEVIVEFLGTKGQSILRVSMESLPFEHHTRELVTNAIGRYLLGLARNGEFSTEPAVVILDEAHQFLNRSVGDEYSRVQLESFGIIAKEGRKYGLTLLLSTQRPRDVPEDVLSQMGMFLVHRLIGDKDRAVVEKACGNLDASAAKFLPTLGQGEAIVVGIGSPMPLPVLVTPPVSEPETKGPDYSKYWG